MLIFIDINSSEYFKMIVEDYSSLNRLQKLLKVPKEYNVLVNGFYEVDNYQIKPYDQISFMKNIIVKEVKNIK